MIQFHCIRLGRPKFYVDITEHIFTLFIIPTVFGYFAILFDMSTSLCMSNMREFINSF